MARLNLPHHPDRVFKDDSWSAADYTSASGYRALATDSDPLEAFAVVLDGDSSPSEHSLYHSIMLLDKPFVRCERGSLGEHRYAVGFYAD